MKFGYVLCLSVAALVPLERAKAEQAPAPRDAGERSITTNSETPTAGAVVQTASVAEPAVSADEPAQGTAEKPAVTAQAAASAASTSASAEAAAKTPVCKDPHAAKPEQPASVNARRHAKLAAAEPKPVAVRPVGKAERGTAAWYGGRYVGRRTSNGERLDAVHATAAHRTLPLNSLARVTNLRNGRSIVVRVTDRGPVSNSLLIDMSPRAADELRMKAAGLVEVMVEQVVEVPPDAR